MAPLRPPAVLTRDTNSSNDAFAVGMSILVISCLIGLVLLIMVPWKRCMFCLPCSRRSREQKGKAVADDSRYGLFNPMGHYLGQGQGHSSHSLGHNANNIPYADPAIPMVAVPSRVHSRRGPDPQPGGQSDGPSVLHEAPLRSGSNRVVLSSRIHRVASIPYMPQGMDSPSSGSRREVGNSFRRGQSRGRRKAPPPTIQTDLHGRNPTSPGLVSVSSSSSSVAGFGDPMPVSPQSPAASPATATVPPVAPVPPSNRQCSDPTIDPAGRDNYVCVSDDCNRIISNVSERQQVGGSRKINGEFRKRQAEYD